MTVNEFLKDPKHFSEIDNILAHGLWKKEVSFVKRPRAHCADGYSISIQANFGAYCEPRTTLWPENWGNGYSQVELGYPSEKDDLIMDYVEDSKSPTNTVYAYVPIELVDKLMEKHGGIIYEE